MSLSLGRQFNAAAAKGVSAVLLAAALLAGNAAFGQKNLSASRVMRAQEDAALMTQTEKDSLNTRLLRSAFFNFSEIAPLASTPYSQKLGQTEKWLNRYLDDVGHDFHTKALIFDPARVAVAQALAPTQNDIAVSLLQDRRTKLPYNFNNGQLVEYLSDTVSSPDNKISVRDEIPGSATNEHGVAALDALIVPSSIYMPVIGVKGMTMEEVATFATLHESFHTLNRAFTGKGFDDNNVNNISAKSDYRNIDSALYARYKDGAEIFSMLCKSEAFSDAGACGTMIQQGASIDLLDKITFWRRSEGLDNEHMSAYVLEGLRDTINTMGLPAFRALDHKESQALYTAVTEKYGMSPQLLNFALAYRHATPGERQKVDAEAAANPFIRLGLGYYHDCNRWFDQKIESTISDSTEKTITGIVNRWDAQRELEDKAFALGRRVTPATLTQSFGALMSDFEKTLKEEPANELCQLRMMKLKEAYVDNTRKIDYAAVNARYGVRPSVLVKKL